MAGRYRPVDRDQAFLVPADMSDWLPVEHPVFFVIEVIEDLRPRLGAFHQRKVLGGVGRAGYDPIMLVTLLVYACWQGVRSSRQIEARCHTDVAFRIICAQDPPDHATIARFRQRTAAAFTDLFTQILLLCAEEGMGRFGKVAIDGTKVAANAAMSANVTLHRVRAVAAAEVAAGLAADADSDTDVDAGPPPRLRDRSHRAARLAQVRAELQAEQAAADKAEAAQQAAGEQYLADMAAGVPRRGRPPKAAAARLADARDEQATAARAAAIAAAAARLDHARATQQAKIDEYEQERAKPLQQRTRHLVHRPAPVEQHRQVRRAAHALARAEHLAHSAAAQHLPPTDPDPVTTSHTTAKTAAKRNLTDPDSRLMPTRNGWIQGYNLQAAVTEDHLTVAIMVTTTPADVTLAQPMLHATQTTADMITAHTGTDTTIGIALFDAGYDSTDNLTTDGPPRLIANHKRHHHEHAAKTNPANGPPPPQATARQAMDHRLRTPEGITTYRKRGAIVEPIFGHLKDILGIRRFLTRGLTNVTGEANLAFATLNLRRLHTHIGATATA